MLLLNLTAYSQELVLNKNGDTCLSFTVERAKYLLKEHYRANEMDSLFKISEKKNENCQLMLKIERGQIEKYQDIVDNKEQLIVIEKERTNYLMNELKTHAKEIKRQKRYKWLAIIAGSCTSVFFILK